MATVFEGRLESSSSSSSSSSDDHELTLTREGYLELNGRPLKNPEKFYFFDTVSQQMLLIDHKKRKGIVRMVHEPDRINCDKRVYLLVSVEEEKKRKVSRWIAVDLSESPLPEFRFVEIQPEQSYYELELHDESLAYPLALSSFQDLSKGRVWVGGLASPQILAYLLVEFEQKNYHVRIIQTMLVPKLVPFTTVQTIQTTLDTITKDEMSRPLMMNPPVQTLGVLSQCLYLADQHGDLIVDFAGVKELVEIPSSPNLILLKYERVETNLRLTFRHRTEGNPNLPEGTTTKSREDFETLTLYYVKGRDVYQRKHPVHRENYSEIIELVGLREDGVTVRQPLQVQYGSLLDKQITLNLDILSDSMVNDRVDITDDVLEQLPFSSSKKALELYYLSQPRGFDLKAKDRLVIKALQPPPDLDFTMTRKILIPGTLRPVLINIRVHPVARSRLFPPT